MSLAQPTQTPTVLVAIDIAKQVTKSSSGEVSLEELQIARAAGRANWTRR